MDDNPFASPAAPQTSPRRSGKRRWLGRLFLGVGFACNAFIMAGVNPGVVINEWIGIGLLIVTLVCIVGSATVYWSNQTKNA